MLQQETPPVVFLSVPATGILAPSIGFIDGAFVAMMEEYQESNIVQLMLVFNIANKTFSITIQEIDVVTPDELTKEAVGLGNVENKSSATIRGELTKANVVAALGYTPPQQDTNTTYENATSSAAGLMSAADKDKLDKIAAGATANVGTITGVTAGNGLTGGGTSGSVTLNVGAGTGITVAADTVGVKLKSATALTNDATAATETSGRVYPVAVDKSGNLAVNVPWTDTDTTYTLGSFGVTATATELNKLDGVTASTAEINKLKGLTATTTELNYVDGVTSNIQEQLNSKVDTNTTYSISKSGSTITLTGSDGSTTSVTDSNTTSFTITAAASDDDVVILSGTSGSNKVTYSASHATKGPSTTASTTKGATADVTVSGSAASGSIKVPKVTVDKYGHTTGLTEQTLSITMPTIPTSLKNPNALTVGSKTYDGSSAVSITAADLGLSAAMKFLGTSATAITDGATTNPITIGTTSTTVSSGNVVLYGSKEFVWNGSSWEELGNEGSYKVVQAAVSSPTASGTTTAFIDTISQDTNGKITATKKTMATATTSAYGMTKLSSATNSTSTDLAATPAAVKAAYDLAASKASTDVATTSANGLMSSSDKTKLNGIATGAEINQNAFSNITIGSTTIAADAKTDTLTLVAGSNVTLTPDATNDKITIAATDTTYSAASQSAAGLMSAADKKKLDGIATGATANTGTITGVTAGNGLTGGGTSGSVSLAVGAGTGISVAADTVSAKLRSTTALTNDSAAATETAGRVYPVAVDKSGYLAVNVPWTDSNTDTKVTQTVRTTDGDFPLLLRGTSAGTTTATTTTSFGTSITGNPGTGTISAKLIERDGLELSRVFTSMIPYGTSIPADVDLNTATYMKVGNYYCSKNVDAATLTNCPTEKAFMLQVYSPLSTTIDNENSTWIYRLRVLQDYTGPQYVQYCYTNGTAGAWTYGDWNLVIKSNNTATTSTAGIVQVGSNLSISSGVLSVPTASGTVAGVTVVYPAASCTTYSSDTGTVTPLAVQKGAKMFAITRPTSSTNKAITRYSNTTGDVQDSKIIIEDVTNTRDTSKTAQVIAIPAEGGKKMVYGYCTDQIDGTSFIGGVFDADATTYPYNEGLAIGGTSGNLLWKGVKVATVSDLPTLSSLGVTATATELNYVDGVTSNIQTQLNGKASTSVATTSANGLMSSTDKTKLNNTNIAYATCSTAAATAAKVATITGNSNWALTTGAIIGIKFTATNTASNPTININSTGAKPVLYGTTALTTSSLSYAGYANRTILYMYDGTNYVFLGWSYDANTDTKVTQANTTADTTYNVLLSYGAASTSSTTNAVKKSANMTFNPSTKTLTVANVAGNASSATKLATARTINGVAFDGTANITVPSSVTIGTITLTASGWVNDSTLGAYKQTATISGLSASHKVDLDADLNTINLLPASIVPYNDNGTFYAVTTTPPSVDIAVQYTLLATN